MERTSLRLSTVAALLGGGGGPTWPTLAEEYVYDSMQDDIVDVVPKRRRPVIVVRTDEDQSIYKSSNQVGRQCQLLIEISVLSARTRTINGKEEPVIEWPRTDSSLEALLDTLEWQVTQALFGYSDWALWWRQSAKYGTISAFTSVPRFSTPDRGAVRLAVRTLTYQMQLPPECVIPMIKEFGPAPQCVLPDRWIKIMCYLAEHTTGALQKAVLAAWKAAWEYGCLPQPTAPPLQRIWATIIDMDGTNTRNRETVEAEWKIEQEAPFVANGDATQPPISDRPVIV